MGFQKSKNNPATNLGKIHSFKSIVHYFLQVCPVKSTSFDAPTLKLKPTLNTSLFNYVIFTFHSFQCSPASLVFMLNNKINATLSNRLNSETTEW